MSLINIEMAKEQKKCIGFILLREYPNCFKKLGDFEPYTTGQFLKYPDIWKPVWSMKEKHFNTK